MKQNTWNSRILEKGLAFLFLLAGYVTNVLYVYQNGKNLINSDASAELILGKQLKETGGFLSKNWYYSSELRVFNTQIVYKLGFYVFPNNWHLVRIFSIAVLLGVFVLSCLFFVWAMGLGREGIWWSAIVIWPFGQWYAWNVIYCSYYIPHIVLSLLSIGLLCKAIRGKGYRKYLFGCFLLIVGFVAGLGGTRQLMVCYVPLFLVMILLLFFSGMGEVTFLHRKYTRWKIEKGALIVSVLLLLAASAGYLINAKILSNIYYYADQGGTLWSDFELTRALDVLADFLALFGWQTSVAVLSLKGVLAALGLLFGLMIGYCVIWLLRHFHQLLWEEEVLTGYFIMAFLVDGLLYSASTVYNQSYWIPIVPFAMLAIFMKIRVAKRITTEQGDQQETKFRKRFLQYYQKALILGIVVLCSINTMLNPYPTSMETDLNIRGAAAFLDESGYTEGFASFWNSDVITELTDGQIEMWTVVNDLNNLERYTWLQSMDHQLPASPQGKFFILLSTDEASGTIIGSTDTYLIYSDDYYKIYGLDSMQEYEAILAAAQ